jgi:hypothetical protein
MAATIADTACAGQNTQQKQKQKNIGNVRNDRAESGQTLHAPRAGPDTQQKQI